MVEDPALTAVLDRVPQLAGPRHVVDLAGGLTNRNLRVRPAAGGDWVVRLSAASSGVLAIDRDAEHANTQAAHTAGVGPPVLARLSAPDTLVVGFLPGRTLTATDVADPALAPRLAGALRRLHAGPAFVGEFDMRTIRRRYLGVVADLGVALPAGYAALGERVEALEAALDAVPEPRVPCNNDLLAANFLDDGEQIWIIDYEYAGMNEASFELGNMAAESALDVEATTALVDAYWGRHSDHRLARAQAWALLAHYGWTLWAVIQSAVSPIDFDFLAWGMAKFDTAAAALRSDGYPRLLARLGGED